MTKKLKHLIYEQVLNLSMKPYDLAVFWEWDYDRAFNHLLQEESDRQRLNILFVSPKELDSCLQKIRQKETRFRWFLDRASETDLRFLPLLEACRRRHFEAINCPMQGKKAVCKSHMHRLLQKAKVPLPETLIIPPKVKAAELPFFTFETLGIPFVLKPAMGGGGDGVHLGQSELSQIQAARSEYPNDEYLVQQTIVPDTHRSLAMWFRVYFICGEVLLSFWDPKTRAYTPLDEQAVKDLPVRKIKQLAQAIARLSKLRFFSSEMAISGGQLVVVDYSNDPVDLRPKTDHRDGIPACLLKHIVESLVRFIRLHKKRG